MSYMYVHNSLQNSVLVTDLACPVCSTQVIVHARLLLDGHFWIPRSNVRLFQNGEPVAVLFILNAGVRLISQRLLPQRLAQSVLEHVAVVGVQLNAVRRQALKPAAN